MTTYVGRARTRIAHERDEVEAKRGAYDRFRARIESISPQAVPADGGATLVSAASTTTAEPIREAFAETIAPVHEERPLVEVLAAELGEGIATALTTDGASSAIHRATRSEADRRRAELAAMDRALGAEADSLARADDVIEPIRGWLVETNETPLSDCGFEELRAYHERLAGFREDCAALLSDRQEHLGRTTSADGRAGLRHRDLVDHLYEGFPIDHPVLVTLVRLDELCTECQRTVRDHLVRRA